MEPNREDVKEITISVRTILVGALVLAACSAIFVLTFMAVMAAAPVVTKTSASFAKGLLDFTGAFLNSFLIKFPALTVAYLIVFTFLVAAIYWLWPRLTGAEGERPTTASALRDAIKKLATKPGSHEDYQMEYLFVILVLTCIIALANPGPPLLTSGLAHIWDSAVSGRVHSTATNAWNFFWYGNRTPPAEIPISSGPEPTWFWFQAVLAYFFLTIAKFISEFWDDVERGFGEGFAILKRGVETARAESRLREETAQKTAAAYQAAQQHAAQQQGGKGKKGGQQAIPQPPPPQPPQPQAQQSLRNRIFEYVTLDIIMEALGAIVKEIYQGYVAKKRRIA